jgi:tRNA(fMet)-specific endonuclease VapC
VLRYLLDTDTCSFLINGRFPEVEHRIHKLPLVTIGISTVTRAELRYGALLKGSARLIQTVDVFLGQFENQSWDQACADVHAEIRAHLKKSGAPATALDTMIAAHAIALDVTLVTHNTRHFEKVPSLRMVDWVKS